MTIAQTKSHTQAIPASGIRDNHHRGSVGSFLQGKIQSGSRLSIVSAYFTIYAFEALKAQLTVIEDLQFLFGEPRFVRSLDPDKTDKKSFQIEDDGLQLQHRLEQKRVAKECADWIQAKVQIRSVKQTNLLHGKMYHIAHNGVEDAITAVFTATEYSLIWRMLDFLGFPGLALYLILGKCGRMKA